MITKMKYFNIFLISVIIFFWLSLILFVKFDRYKNFLLTLDIALYSNMLWNTDFQNKILYSDQLFYSRGIDSGLSEHFFPTILLLVPIYHFFPYPVWLLFLQGVAVAFSAILLYFFSVYLLNDKRISILLTLAYLFHPAVIGATLDASHGFHHDSLIPLFLFLSALFFVKRRFLYFLMSLILLLGLKESLPFLGLLFGVGLLFRKDEYKKYGLITIFISIFFIFFGLYLFPMLSNSKPVHAVGFLNIISNSGNYLNFLLNNTNLKYWAVMLSFFPSVFSPLIVLALVDMGIYILGYASPFDQHSFASSAILSIASVGGLYKLYNNDIIYFIYKRYNTKHIVLIIKFIFAISILIGVLF